MAPSNKSVMKIDIETSFLRVLDCLFDKDEKDRSFLMPSRTLSFTEINPAEAFTEVK